MSLVPQVRVLLLDDNLGRVHVLVMPHRTVSTGDLLRRQRHNLVSFRWWPTYPRGPYLPSFGRCGDFRHPSADSHVLPSPVSHGESSPKICMLSESATRSSH